MCYEFWINLEFVSIDWNPGKQDELSVKICHYQSDNFVYYIAFYKVTNFASSNNVNKYMNVMKDDG